MISYCTSIKNRLEHFKKASVQTIESLLKLDEKYLYEWCICDYNSNDGLEEYIRSLNFNKIVYKKIKFREHFHHSRAKNISHKMASGDYMVNLDADNIVTPQFHKEIYKLFKKGANVIWPTTTPNTTGGGTGRIAIDKQTFFKLGGYDENIVGWGYEDIDLIERSKKLNCNIQIVKDVTIKYIRHSEIYRFAETVEKSREESGPRNKKYMDVKLLNNSLIANVGTTWGV